MLLEKNRYGNWKNNIPSNFLEYLFSPASTQLRLVNFFFQKICRLNSGVNFMLHYTSQASGDIQIGAGVARYMAGSGNCYFQGISGIIIGDNTMIAPGVKIISANHKLDDFKMHVKADPIVIGSNCWLGANSVILPSCNLGNNVIVGAGAVVTKSFESNVVIGGNPAKVIRKLTH